MQRLPTVGFALVVAMGIAGMIGMAVYGTTLQVAGPWVNATADGPDTHQGYFTLKNLSTAGRRLVAVESPSYNEVRVLGGFSSKQVPLAIGPRGQIEFQPSGPFVQLQRPKEPHPGMKTIPMVLVFEDGERMLVKAPIKTIVTLSVDGDAVPGL